MRIACAEDDRMTPVALSEAMASFVPHASTRRFERGGHYVPRSCAAEVADDIRAFLGST